MNENTRQVNQNAGKIETKFGYVKIKRQNAGHKREGS